MAILGVCAPFFWSPIPNSFSELGLGTKKKGAQTPKIAINKVLLDVAAAMTIAMAMSIFFAIAMALWSRLEASRGHLETVLGSSAACA